MIITAQKGRGKKIHILVDGEYTFTTDEEFWYSSFMKSGAELTEEEYAEFKEKADYRFGMNRSMDLLSGKDYSRAELIKKLTQKISQETAERVAERIEELGLINDGAYAAKVAEYYAVSKNMGKKGIRSKLYQKGFTRDVIDETMENLVLDEEDSAVAVIRKKYYNYLNDEKGRKKVFSALIRLGYSYSDARSALRKCAEESDLYCEE